MVSVSRSSRSSRTSFRVYHHELRNRFDRGVVILLLCLACFLWYDKSHCPPCPQVPLLHQPVPQPHDNSGESFSSGDSSFKHSPSSSSSSSESESDGISSLTTERKAKSSQHSSSGPSHVKNKDAKSEPKQESKKEAVVSSGSSVVESSGSSEAVSSNRASTEVSGDSTSIQSNKFTQEGSKWKNKYDVVHIVTTRYMQLQPNLIHLGKARNDLMRVFALPGFVNQTTQEYIWIIFTDPDLNKELLDEVVDMIKPYPNILLLGMNNGMNAFQRPDWMKHIKHVFSGDFQMLQDYRKASTKRVLLETRLDADDSIFVEMMDAVQKQAAETLGKRAIEAQYNANKLEKEFRILCTEHHLEWGYFNPWEKKSEKGHLFGIHKPEWCVSAGLTHVYQVGTVKNDLPTKSHHKMNEKIPQCGTKKSEIKAARNCIERIDAKSFKFIMMRSRTPTSAGMLGVIPKKEVVESDTWKNKQDLTWANVVERNFAIPPQSIFDLRVRLKNNMENILTDALAGQCTKQEFTCKDETKRDLNNLLEAVKENS